MRPTEITIKTPCPKCGEYHVQIVFITADVLGYAVESKPMQQHIGSLIAKASHEAKKEMLAQPCPTCAFLGEVI